MNKSTKKIVTAGASLLCVIAFFTWGWLGPVSLTVLYFALRLMFYELGRSDILVTLRTEGEIKAIMCGEAIRSYIVSIEGYFIDPDDYDIVPGYASEENPDFTKYISSLMKVATRKIAEEEAAIGREEKISTPWVEHKLQSIMDNGRTVAVIPKLLTEFQERLVAANTPDLFEQIFGVVWVGLPPNRVFRYEFVWGKYGTLTNAKGELTKVMGITQRRETVNSIFFRYPNYAVSFNDAETGAGSLGENTDLNRVQLSCTLVIETRTRNPQKALFRSSGLSSPGEWLPAINREAHNRFRELVRLSDYDTLIGGKEAANDRKTVDQILEDIKAYLNNDKDEQKENSQNVSAIHDYGIEVVKVSCPNIDLADEGLQKKVEEVFASQMAARKSVFDLQTTENRAKGETALAKAPYTALLESIKPVADNPEALRVFEANALGQVTTLVLGNGSGTLINIPGNETKSPKGGTNKPNPPTTS